MNLGDDSEESVAQLRVTERIALTKSNNRLATAFSAWAIVVGIVGTLSLILMARFTAQADDNSDDILLLQERQAQHERRLNALETRFEAHLEWVRQQRDRRDQS